VVLDASSHEGLALGDALGAINLDNWQAVMVRAKPVMILDEIAETLRAAGESWRIVALQDAVEPISALNFARFERGVSRLVAIDSMAEPLQSAIAGLQTNPAQAKFELLEWILVHVAVKAAVRRRALSQAAQLAIEEAVT
jgi:hypothetical protein